MGQEIRELIAHIAVAGLGAEDLHVGGKLGQKLAAGAAGRAPVLAVGIDGDAAEFPVPLADGLDAGGALGADGGADFFRRWLGCPGDK